MTDAGPSCQCEARSPFDGSWLRFRRSTTLAQQARKVGNGETEIRARSLNRLFHQVFLAPFFINVEGVLEVQVWSF